MPIYEFYCGDCHTIFNFFSQKVNTEKRPICPKCKKRKLERQMSSFAVLRGAKEESDIDLPDIDEEKMEKAMSLLAREAEGMDEEDPRQAASLMRRFSDMTGLNLGPGMEEALRRMEAGEDPDKLEEEMGDLFDEENPFTQRPKRGKKRKREPLRDDTLYEL
jgi:putative FmdB family regulatory protein